MNPRFELQSERLLLQAPHPDQAKTVAEFFARNQVHLARWSPPIDASSVTPTGQALRLESAQAAFEVGAAWRWNLYVIGANTMVGFVNFSQIHCSIFQSCMLGYALGQEYEGKGLMREGLQTPIDEVFSERGRMHRIQANVMPENIRSLGLLDRLGFKREGLAKDYLFIDGAWRDHVMTALHNELYDASCLS